MTKMLNIAIVGAGIGGLAAAALLARDGHHVTLLDQFEAPAPVGSGLVIQPVGQAVLAACGAGSAARALGVPITRMLGHEAKTGARVLDVSYGTPKRPHTGLGIHRAALFQTLLDAALRQGVAPITGARVVGAPANGAGRTVVLADGRRLGPFDLVVDASGAGSVLSPLKGRTLSYGALWGTVPWPAGTDLPPDQLTQRYRMAFRMMGVLPIGTLPGDATPRAAIFWSLPAAGEAAFRTRPLAVWKAEAISLWPAFGPFLQTIQTQQDLTMARYSHGTLARPFAPGIAFVGDAAHRASPQLGQGANMALLDVWALTLALRAAPLPQALQTYAAARRRHVAIYQALSAAFTPQFQSDSLVLPVLRDRVLMPLSRIPPAPRVLTRLVCGDLVAPMRGVANTAPTAGGWDVPARKKVDG